MSEYGEMVRWEPVVPRLRVWRVLVSWVVAAASVAIAAWIVPGVDLEVYGGGVRVAALIAILNAVLPPFLAALRLPFMLVAGFLVVLAADALVLQVAGDVLSDDVHVGSFGDALLAALVMSAVSLVIQMIIGANDDANASTRSRSLRRIARRQGVDRAPTDVPGIIYLEIDGLALPVLRRRDARRERAVQWRSLDLRPTGDRLVEWETDLSSQTGASQAGILLGSNGGHSGLRWVPEKETGLDDGLLGARGLCRDRAVTPPASGCSSTAEPSRGNLLSGEADETILTVSRTEAEKRAKPGLPSLPRERIQRDAGARPVRLGGPRCEDRRWAIRAAPARYSPPRSPRRDLSASCAGAMCVIVRDLVVFGVLTGMMRGRPAVVCDVRELRRGRSPLRVSSAPTRWRPLRKLDQQSIGWARARRYAPRPY